MGLNHRCQRNKQASKRRSHRAVDKPRYFERPDEGEKPLGLWRTVLIVMSTHLGVRAKEKRQEDFRRANGLHVFIAGIIYFISLLLLLIWLVNFISKG